jgi:hypothetical protein
MKKFLYLLPVVVLLAAGCNTTKQVEQQQPVSNNQQTQTTSPSPTPTPSAAQPAETKTYSNKEYGFSVKYPSEFSIAAAGETGLTLPSGTLNYLDSLV